MEEHPANLGRLCVKGSALHETVSEQQRLLYPEIRGQRVSWDAAMAATVQGFSSIIAEHGPQAAAFYLSGQLLTEDYYVANKLMKGFIGSANVDTNSRLCMASAVVGHKRAFGADGVPLCYEDLELCDLLVLTGSNAAWTHPVLYQRISAARKLRPQMKIVVIDPRTTASCDLADMHLAIRPATDSFVFNGLLQYLNAQGRIDEKFTRQHCEGLEEALLSGRECTLPYVAGLSGIDEDQLLAFYQMFAATEKTVTFFSQGINQSATGSDKCNAIINCHLASGRIGRPGMGPFSITGQPNAMGGREVGGLANQLAAHMDFNAADIKRVGRFWQAPNMATAAGHKATDMFEAIRAGEIKAVWIMATNPVVSLPDSARVAEALQGCELVVVSDCIRHTDTNAHAHILLPAAGWGEKEGTVSNSERCISRQRALLPALGEARQDWKIICDFAAGMGFGKWFSYSSPQEIFVEHAALSGFENAGSRLFDISGLQSLDNEGYEKLQPIQWPVNAAHPRGTKRLFEDLRFFTATGKARLVPVRAQLPARQTNEAYPFLLNTGRLRDQWHTMTRTGLVPRLLQHVQGPFVSIHPALAAQLELEVGDLLDVSSDRGRALLPVSIDGSVRRNEVFAPIHWNRQFSLQAGVSSLFESRVDPWSGQPESKYQPVALRKMAIHRWLKVVSRTDIPLTDCDYWHKRPLSGGTEFTLALAEGSTVSVPELLQRSYPGQHSIEFLDDASGNQRLLLVDDRGRLLAAGFSAASLTGLPDSAWLDGLLSISEADIGWHLLSGAGLGDTGRGRLVCSCFEVGEQEIIRAIGEGDRSHEQLGQRLQCGTNCGSCIPELRQLIRQHTEELTTVI